MKKILAITLSLSLMLSQTAFAANGCGTYSYVGQIRNGRIQKVTSFSNSCNTSCSIQDILNQCSKYLNDCLTNGRNNSCGKTQPSCGAEKQTQQTTLPQSEPKTEVTTKAPVTQTETKTEPKTEPKTEATTRKHTEPTTEVTTQAVSKPQTSPNTDVATSILNLVNRQRSAQGLKSLSLDSALNNAATLKAQDMADKGYFDHTSPTYGTPFQMLKSLGISYRSAGENIAKGQKTPEAVMNAWMNSSGHRANILNSSYGKLGVGYVVKNGTTYWVQIFTN